MKEKIPTYSLANNFKQLIFLSSENNRRSFEQLKYFNESLNVLYISFDTSEMELFKDLNLDIISFKNFLNLKMGIVYQFNKFRLVNKINSYLKRNNISLKETLFFVNSLQYSFLLDDYNQSVFHYDNICSSDSDLFEESDKYMFFKHVNSITTNSLEIKWLLDDRYDCVVRVPDGVDENVLFDFQEDSFSEVLGCYLPDPVVLDYDLARYLAENNNRYHFIFYSSELFPESFVSIDNLEFITTSKKIDGFKVVILPFKSIEANKINELFYCNLAWNAPMMSIKRQELYIHKAWVNLYKNKESMCEGLKEIKNLKMLSQTERKLLYEGSSWRRRVEQIESVIQTFE